MKKIFLTSNLNHYHKIDNKKIDKHLGFNDIDKEQVVNGLKFYPMKALLYGKVELKQYNL